MAEKFDLFWFSFVNQDSTKKSRPVLILEENILMPVAQITSHDNRGGKDYTIIDWKEAGLDKPSVIRFAKIQFTTSNLLGDKIGHLSKQDIEKIKEIKLVEKLNENTVMHYYLCSIYGGYNCQELLADDIEVYAKNEEQAKREAIKIYKQEYNYSKEANPFGLDAKIVSSDEDELEEDIEKHDTLNPKLFDGEELKPEVKEAVEKIVNEFVDGLHEDGIKFDLKDVVLIGSNVSYNYTKDSDLDIHLIADSSKLECPDDLYPLLYSAYRSIFNKNYDITIKGIPAEIYVEMDEPQAKSNGIYSINTGWIKKPEQQNIPDLDQEAFDKLFNEWEDKYFDLISKTDIEIEGEKPIETTENELVEKIVKKGSKWQVQSEKGRNMGTYDTKEEAEKRLKQVEYFKHMNESVESDYIEEIDNFIEDLYNLRKEGIAKDGEYSLTNLIFKEFRNLGYLDNLKELKRKLKSRDLSLEKLEN